MRLGFVQTILGDLLVCKLDRHLSPSTSRTDHNRKRWAVERVLSPGHCSLGFSVDSVTDLTLPGDTLINAAAYLYP